MLRLGGLDVGIQKAEEHEAAYAEKERVEPGEGEEGGGRGVAQQP